MKKGFFLILTVCLALGSLNMLFTRDNDQDPQKKKAKFIRISGIVKDEQGNRLKDVMVIVVRESESESPAGVVSGNEGTYNILTKSDRTLIFSLNGYESQRISIKGRDEIDVTMKKIPEKKE
ncbi:MAG: carboxypeptidase-like regulatory domain-containing protein [Bacteroidales bacterium]|nr:carboxypeptidase-like regulatory domain-containing protein [Bacteroidales bacterium]MDD3812870.1 carboxypeptidase-like regulatory domain-containing protein [Bacteroidales bacterium]MDD3990169.1 carboxypeptidase-like regulatory domain-containing protein [Bacteroidales bacterium]